MLMYVYYTTIGSYDHSAETLNPVPTRPADMTYAPFPRSRAGEHHFLPVKSQKENYIHICSSKEKKRKEKEAALGTRQEFWVPGPFFFLGRLAWFGGLDVPPQDHA